MNIASISGVNITPLRELNFSEVIPYSASNNVNVYLSQLFNRQEVVAENDALQAVKLDPAVLEAQVTQKVDCNQNITDKDQIMLVANKERSPPSNNSFESMVTMQQAALLSLTPHKLGLLMEFVDTLRRQRTSNQINLECAFCKKNGESLSWYSSHALKNYRGRVQCPVLRAFRCPRCGATGDRAHTIKYCPENNEADAWNSSSFL